MSELLSDKFARAAVAGVYFDADRRSPRGFMLRVTPAGARSWCLNYRLKDTGRERRITIGDAAAWPLAEARKRAAELRRIVDAGGDPLGEREERRREPAVAELWEQFVVESLPRRAASTQHEYQAAWRDWVAPAIGKLKVSAVSRSDIEKLHRKISERGKLRRANAIKSLCSTLFAQAIAWEMLEDNPARGIRGNREHARHRYLNDDELARLEATLDHFRPKCPHSVDIIEIAMLTGARRGEILSMRWHHLDLAKAVWNQPATETKQRDWHSPALPARAVEILQRRKTEREARTLVRLRDTDFVFPDGNERAGRSRLERDWMIIRATAGLNDFHFHDIRHSVASWLISANLNLDVIGQVLGHKKAATTRRYAHLHDAARRSAAAILNEKLGARHDG